MYFILCNLFIKIVEDKPSYQSKTASNFNKPDRDYEGSLLKTDMNINHHSQCVDSPERKVNRKPPSKEYKVQFDAEAEKLQNLKDQNIKLKTKKRELEDNVKQIATKLKRQITQLKKDRIVGAGGNITKKIDDELDGLIDENVKLQDDEQRLIEKVKALQAKRKLELSSGMSGMKKLQSTTDNFRKSSKSRSPNRVKNSDVELQSLRNHIENGNKQIMQLKNEIEILRRNTSGGIQGSIATEELASQLRLKELQCAQEQAKLDDLKDNFKIKDEIFTQNKTYQDGLLKELRDLQTEQLELSKQNRAFDQSAKEAEYLQTKIAEVTIERDKLHREFETLTRQPFFKREDQNHFAKINDIEKKLDQKERDIKQSKTNTIKLTEDLMALNQEVTSIKSERDTYAEEIDRLKIQLDPNSLSLADIQKKIHDLDPSMFRQVMKDLKYDGDEPIWAKFDFMERLKLGPNNQPLDETNPTELKREIERLKIERKDLASELQKFQNLLKIQVDIDKQSASEYQNRIHQIQAQISSDNKKITEYNQLIKLRGLKVQEIQKQTGMQRLTAAGLAQIDQQTMNQLRKDDELLSEFSAVTHESEMAPQENAFELLVSSTNFDKQRLTQILGNKELLSSAVQTFITVDFFNHDTKHSDLAEGFEPNYGTQFSFKNTVDDFYIQFIEKNYVLIEFFLSRAQSALKIGVAKLPLSKILEKDSSFQAQEVVYEGGEMGGTFNIGRILYKMRMRKPIDEAIKWYEQKKALNFQKDPTIAVKQSLQDPSAILNKRAKVVTITVTKGFDFRRNDQTYSSKNMQPFFYFQFYSFEYTSPIVTGNSPVFQVSKQFEIEDSHQFLDYMKTQLLKIDFIDESVEMKEGQDDYIGSVRIPLRDLLLNETIADNFAVKDEMGRDNGRIEIKIECKDYSAYTKGVYTGSDGSTITLSKFMEQDIIKKIAEALSEAPIEDIDILFDFFNSEGKDRQKIFKKEFKDFILQNLRIRQIREIDLEVFMKSASVFAQKDYIDRNDFKNMFEFHIRENRNSKLEQRMEFEKRYSQAQSFFKQGVNMNSNFGQTTNVFLDQSLNNRVDQTPIFETSKKIDFGNDTFTQKQLQPVVEVQKTQTLQKQNTKKEKPLIEQLKEGVYHFINKFEEIVGADTQGVTWEQFKKVMLEITKDEDDIAGFWGQYNVDGQFYYHQQLLYLSNVQIQQDKSTALLNKVNENESNPFLNNIKRKIQEHMLKKDYSLEVIFRFLDKDKSNGINIIELTKGLKDLLDEQECRVLFEAVDRDRSGEISYNEIITECSRINCAYVLFNIRQFFDNDKKVTVEQIFGQFDRNKGGFIEIHEFNDMLNFLYGESVGKLEIDSLFKHFDSSGTGKINKEDFKRQLTQQIQLENTMKPNHHEILTPLITKFKQMGLTPAKVFEMYAKGKTAIQFDDFKNIVYCYLQFKLNDQEADLLKGLIIGMYKKGNAQIEKNDFIHLLSQNYMKQSFAQGNKTIAQQTFSKMKAVLKMKKRTIQEVIKEFQDDSVQHNINIRNMRIFLFAVFTLPVYDIENLIEYLDKDGNGFIPAQDVIKEVELSK